MRRQWVADVTVDHNEIKQQSSTFIEWCDDADNWGDEQDFEENGNAIVKSQAIESNALASAELEKSDGDDNVVVEPIELPHTDVLQLLDSRKEIISVSYVIIYYISLWGR